MSLGAAVLVFGCPTDAEARPGGGTRSMALGAQSSNAARAAIKPKWGFTTDRQAQRGDREADHREAALGSWKS